RSTLGGAGAGGGAAAHGLGATRRAGPAARPRLPTLRSRLVSTFGERLPAGLGPGCGDRRGPASRVATPGSHRGRIAVLAARGSAGRRVGCGIDGRSDRRGGQPAGAAGAGVAPGMIEMARRGYTIPGMRRLVFPLKGTADGI